MRAFADTYYWIALTDPGDEGHGRASAILADPSVTVIPQSRESFLSGLELYRDRSDKGYSLTNCISMKRCAGRP